jgi:hypothetical protein
MANLDEDHYFLAILQALTYGFRLGKSLEQITADVADTGQVAAQALKNYVPETK